MVTTPKFICGLKDTARQRAVIRPSTTICSFSAYGRASRGVNAMSMSVLAPGASNRCPPETDRCSLLSYLHHMVLVIPYRQAPFPSYA